MDLLWILFSCLSIRLTQKELSEKTGISHKAISLLETGRGRNITMRNFLTLLRAVGMLQNIGVPSVEIYGWNAKCLRN